MKYKREIGDSALFICDRCKGIIDVALVYINDVPKTYCEKCRSYFFSKKNPVGRQAIGITKKVSITLSDAEWLWVEENGNQNRSAFFRELVKERILSEGE